jgi:hypothetical protein
MPFPLLLFWVSKDILFFIPDFSVSKPCQKYAHGFTFGKWAYIWCKLFISDFSLNSKLKSILMGVSVEDSDIEAIGSDDEDRRR